jgi:hypothetical protein
LSDEKRPEAGGPRGAVGGGGVAGSNANHPTPSKAPQQARRRAHRADRWGKRRTRPKAARPPPPVLDAEGFPIVHCARVPSNPTILKFWCPYCRHAHTHGDPDGSAGHRGAHCFSELGRMMFRRGYILIPVAADLPCGKGGRS